MKSQDDSLKLISRKIRTFSQIFRIIHVLVIVGNTVRNGYEEYGHNLLKHWLKRHHLGQK